jgi:hypothetical protein
MGAFVVQTDLPQKEESYSLTAYLAGTLTDGEHYKARPEVLSFRIEKPAMIWPWFAGGFVGLLVSGGLVYLWHWLRLPVLSGVIEIQRDQNTSSEYHLTGRRKLIVKIGKGSPIPLPPDDPKKCRVVAKIRGKRSDSADGLIEVLPLISYRESKESKSFAMRELHDEESIVVSYDCVLTYRRYPKVRMRLVVGSSSNSVIEEKRLT